MFFKLLFLVSLCCCFPQNVKIITKIQSTLQDLKHILYPKLCVACETELPIGTELLCTYCKYDLPITDFHLDIDNSLAKLFWGRVPVENAAAYYYFRKGGKVQKLIHKLKYENQPQIGIALGEFYGYILKEADFFSAIDLIIPVPLHPKRLYKRGYNQSAKFAIGLSSAMKIPWEEEAFIRIKHTKTQTRQEDKMMRFENVKNAFRVVKPSFLEGKHLLVVDDVITSGATLETCVAELLKVPNVKISIASIAVASD